MTEPIGIQEYINKRLSALDLVDSTQQPMQINKGEVVIGTIIRERTKKVFLLSKKVSKEMENLSLKIKTLSTHNFQGPHGERVRSLVYEMAKLDCVRRSLDSEFLGTLLFEFEKMKDYADSNLCIAVRKDWKVIVVTGELLQELSEFLIGEEIKNSFTSPSAN